VKMAETKGCALSDISAADLRTINPLFEDDVVEVRAAHRNMRCTKNIFLPDQMSFDIWCFDFPNT